MKLGIILKVAAAFLLSAAAVHAEEISCNGTVFSMQDVGIGTLTHRFVVDRVTGSDLPEVVEKCRMIALDRQAKISLKARVHFHKFSALDLQCVKGAEKFPLKRTVETGP